MMDYVETQNILLVILKTFGFFPMKFGEKYKKIKNHLYNLVVSGILLITFTIVGIDQMSQALIRTTENNSALGYLTVMIEISSTIVGFATIKLYLLVQSEEQEKYFDKLRGLKITVRTHRLKNTKINIIIQELRMSTLRQEIFVSIYYLLMQFSYSYIAVTDNILLYTFVGLLFDIHNAQI
jgi:hypothetical protein